MKLAQAGLSRTTPVETRKRRDEQGRWWLEVALVGGRSRTPERMELEQPERKTVAGATVAHRMLLFSAGEEGGRRST